MKWQRLLNASATVVLLVSAGCNAVATPGATSTASAATSTSPAPTDTETAVVSASPTPEPPSLGEPAAPPHYQVGDPIQLDEIHMMNANEGWALSGPYVLVTTDGGVTWREATPPETFPNEATATAYGAFTDSQTAWVIFSIGKDQQDPQIAPEASVWHTADGGQTWTRGAPLLHEAYGDYLWAEFAALNAEEVWLLVRGVYSAAGRHFRAQLFHTSDGGVTWTPLAGEADLNWDFTGMVFSDGANGWLTWQTTGAYASSPPEYAVTNDGGDSWETFELPPPPDTRDFYDQYEYCEPYQPNLISDTSIRMLMGCFDYFDPPQEYVSYLYASDDGGFTWEITRLPEPVLASLSTLIYFDADYALLLGREMYSSADGGRTWTHVKTVYWDGQFSFVGPGQGWAIASSSEGVALVRTVDGGRTWALIKPVIGP